MSTSTSERDEKRNEKRKKLLEGEEKIREKFLDRFSPDTDTKFVEQSEITFMKTASDQLQSLARAQPRTIDITADITADNLLGAGINTITRYDISLENNFLGLACEPERFYVRQGYDELYDYICEQWKSKKRYRVILLGNAGTGKSWFQVYALKRLMMSGAKEEREFDFVIRHVASCFYLIDLEEAKVYLWDIHPNHLIALSNEMTRTLYFFEPDNDAYTPPLALFRPSLSTLSPNIPRIHHYGKRYVRTVYFWPWSSGELWTIIKDSELSISDTVFKDRYRKFGGIVRHILGETEDPEGELTGRLNTVTLDILTSTSLNIDRNATGDNVSGFLVCYDSRSITGSDRFAVKNLEYTSPYVVQEIERRIGNLSDGDIMQNVLDHLNGIKIDISGKNLEEAAIKLLSRGNRLEWVRKEIGVNGAVWERFSVSKKKLRAPYRITKHFDNPGLVLAPTDLTFPVVHFVFSHTDHDSQPVRAFQCTWAESHGVVVNALCTLRKKHMGISAEQVLEIYFVCPGQEDAYASRNKEAYFLGAPTARSPELETILINTKLFVIRPKDSWKQQIGAYFSSPE